MSTIDERLVTLRLCRNWLGRIERDELELPAVWDLLRERIAAFDKKFQACPTCGGRPCSDESYCASMRAADQKIAAARKCSQCGAPGGSDLDPYQDREK